MTSKQLILNFVKKKTTIENCDVIIAVQSKRHSKIKINHVMILKKTNVILSHLQQQVKIHHLNISKKIDYFFESNEVNFSLYVHVINVKTFKIVIQNEENKLIKISKNFRLKRATKLNFFNAYDVIKNNVMNLINKQFKQFHKKIYFHKLFWILMNVVQTKNNIEIKIIQKKHDQCFSINFVEFESIRQTKKKLSFMMQIFFLSSSC